MASRLKLHTELVKLLGSDNVYFQPPESLIIRYPAIVYTRVDMLNRYADNEFYFGHTAYQIVIIDKNPDSEHVEKMRTFHNARFERHYVSNNLNHDAFRIYY